MLLGQGLLEESDTGIRDREATVELATGNINIDGLFVPGNRVSDSIGQRFDRALYLLEPLEGILRKVVPLRMSQDILGQGGEDGLEVSALGRSHD